MTGPKVPVTLLRGESGGGQSRTGQDALYGDFGGPGFRP